MGSVRSPVSDQQQWAEGALLSQTNNNGLSVISCLRPATMVSGRSPVSDQQQWAQGALLSQTNNNGLSALSCLRPTTMG